MPVKNTKRRTNDGLEGVITGLTEEEKKVLEDAGIGGGTAVEANPPEEATQQLDKIKIDNIAYNIAGGGSGGSGFIVKSITTQIPSTGIKDNLDWVTGRELKANTAYSAGAQVQIKYTKTFGSWSVDKNNIAIPIVAFKQASISNQRLLFGDVILVCTDADYSITTTKSNNTFNFTVFNLLTYTVVKAGTTGTDLEIPRSIMDEEELIINFYDLEPVTE